MIIKNGEILKSCEKLRTSFDECSDSLPVRVAFKLIKNKKEIDAAFATYEEARAALIKKHTGGEPFINSEHPNIKAFLADLSELDAVGCEINISVITLSEIEAFSLPLNVMDAISFMIED